MTETVDRVEGDGMLRLSDLSVDFVKDMSSIRAVNDVSFRINKGEVLALVGESGSGKTMTALSIMRLVPPPGRIVGGKILFHGDDLLQASEKQMESVRGKQISMIFQEPMTALNPVFKVGDQVAEILSLHTRSTRSEATDRTMELLANVGFDKPNQKYIQYPHQLSGGQRQRILIAISIACSPSLIIADEPTTALDVATEGQILCLLQGLVEKFGMSMLFITHNLHVVKSIGDRIGIMYAGRIMEENTTEDFFRKPLHPYSEGLLESSVKFAGTDRRLKAIPGFVPRLSELPGGCKFHPRCSHVMPRCRSEEPPFVKVGVNKWVRCYLYQN